MSNRDLPWDTKGLSLNKNISYSIVSKYPFTKWDFNLLSSNPNIKIEDVRRNLNLPWSFHNLSSNPNLTLNFVRRFISKIGIGMFFLQPCLYFYNDSKEQGSSLGYERSFPESQYYLSNSPE